MYGVIACVGVTVGSTLCDVGDVVTGALFVKVKSRQEIVEIDDEPLVVTLFANRVLACSAGTNHATEKFGLLVSYSGTISLFFFSPSANIIQYLR